MDRRGIIFKALARKLDERDKGIGTKPYAQPPNKAASSKDRRSSFPQTPSKPQHKNITQELVPGRQS